MAKKKNGNIKPIMTNTAALLPIIVRVKRYVGMPIATALPKQINCLLVKFNNSRDFTVVKSRGICV